MCAGYGLPHESFTWAIRTEPGVVGAFEKVYEDENLIVSFDAVNMSFPNRKDLKENKPWPHQDQDRTRPGFRCLQGLVNLLPNGPDDGGLIVCKGGHLLSEEFHAAFENESDRIWAWYVQRDSRASVLPVHLLATDRCFAGPGSGTALPSQA